MVVLAAPIDDVRAATKDATDTTPKKLARSTTIDAHPLRLGDDHIMTETRRPHLETPAVEVEAEADGAVHQKKDHRVAGNRAKRS